MLICIWQWDIFRYFYVMFDSHSFFFFFLAVLGLRFLRGLSLVAASGGHSSSWCADLSLSGPLLLRGTDSRRTGSVVVAHGPSCSAACGIFPDQASNPCPLHWQADSQPLRHQGSPDSHSWMNFIYPNHQKLEDYLASLSCSFVHFQILRIFCCTLYEKVMTLYPVWL